MVIENKNVKLEKQNIKLLSREGEKMKKIYSLILIFGLVLIGFINEVSADEINTNDIINNNGITITENEFNNLINLGFTENEILNMTLTEFNENKDLIGNVVSTSDKYYKVITNYDEYNNIVSTTSEEISEYVYNNHNLMFGEISPLSVDGYSETNYKKMRSQIILLTYGYRYKMTVEWKNIPSTRSYDIIGIGIDTNVYVSSDVIFQQNYCYSNGSCSSSNVSAIKKTTTGGAALFKLPTSSSITSMDSYIYFMVDKTSSSTTLNTMYAYGDYSHAIENTSSSNTSYYSISKGGLNLYSSIINSYDAVPVTKAEWTGTW